MPFWVFWDGASFPTTLLNRPKNKIQTGMCIGLRTAVRHGDHKNVRLAHHEAEVRGGHPQGPARVVPKLKKIFFCPGTANQGNDGQKTSTLRGPLDHGPPPKLLRQHGVRRFRRHPRLPAPDRPFGSKCKPAPQTTWVPNPPPGSAQATWGGGQQMVPTPWPPARFLGEGVQGQAGRGLDPPLPPVKVGGAPRLDSGIPPK